MLTWLHISIFSILAFIVRSHILSHQYRTKERSFGCKPAFVPAAGLWSIFASAKTIIRVAIAGWNGTLHVLLRARFAEASAEAGYCVKTIMLQSRNRILTCDEANVHAILTTQSHEFNPGRRKEFFSPMLGEHTIVSALSLSLGSRRFGNGRGRGKESHAAN